MVVSTISFADRILCVGRKRTRAKQVVKEVQATSCQRELYGYIRLKRYNVSFHRGSPRSETKRHATQEWTQSKQASKQAIKQASK